MGGKNDKKVKIYKKKRKNIPEEKVIADLQARYEDIDETKITKFADLPLSPKTQKGLRENEFIEPTDIQKQSIGLALRGNDILGAAQTGSGKTLAFLIPVLEILYCKRWTRLDGVGALIITPTRELAYQIYETLRKVGSHHEISAGLVIGGKDLQFEKKRMDQCNIVICTPGRLLQHMDENPLFDCVTMQVLVLDEADRCLDMGFETTMNAIIENLPAERQTLLFSATQTKSVRDLARLSLKNPMYISVHEHAEHTTPDGLQQSYVICNLEDKMAMLWSFIKHHLKQKVIVFFSSCKQVKYTYEILCRMRPGTSLLALYGKLHQLKRMSIYESFCKKQNAVLFATDIAARGLDFPAVNWVVQMDCPEDTNAYIHRAGRTARFQRGGESLLVLLPSEEQMVERLREKKIPISMIKINPNKLHYPNRKFEALLPRDVALKETAQRAFVAYVKSVFLMKDKEIFDVHSLDTDSYAKSLGLAIPPRIRFLQRMQKDSTKAKESKSAKAEKSQRAKMSGEELAEKMLQSRKSSDDESEDNSASEVSEDEEQNEEPRNMRKNDANNALFDNDDSDDEGDILTVKRKNVQIEDEFPDEFADDFENANSKNKKAVTKAALAKKILRKKIVPNKKTTFGEDGEELVDSAKSKVSELAKQYENEETSGINIEIAKQILREEDHFDKKRFQAKIREKHREEKRKLKASKKKAESEEEVEDGEDDDDDDEDGGGGVRLADYESGSEASEPDLSWLPDPDKIYGPKKDSDDERSEENSDGEEDEDEDDDDDEEEDQIHRPPKRKLVTQDEVKKKRQKIIKVKENSDLIATEELALQLLRN